MAITFQLSDYSEPVIGGERGAWEYFLKSRYFTADLYITDMMCLQQREQIEEWDQRAAKDFGRDFSYVVIDLGRLDPPPSLTQDFSGRWRESELIINELKYGMFDCKFLMPLNFAPPPVTANSVDTLVHRCLIFKIAIGKSMTFTNLDRIPEHFDSIIYQTEVDLSSVFEQVRTENTDFFKYNNIDFGSQRTVGGMNLQSNQAWVRLKYPSLQALPLYLCTLDFRPVRIQTSMPVCDVCTVSSATFYCPADKSHFCGSCDVALHSKSSVVAKHKRVPITESPHMFGNCSEHPSAVIDAVCEGCFQSLCSYCLLLGNHALVANPREHPLVSTFEAYRNCISGTSEADQALRAVRQNIGKNVHKLESGLKQCLRNFKNIAMQLEDLEAEAISTINTLYNDRRSEFLKSIRKQYVMEMLFWTVIENFWSHVSKTLPPALYLTYKRKLSRLILLWASDETDNVDFASFGPQLYQASTSVPLQALLPSWWSSSRSSKTIPDIAVTGNLTVMPINKEPVSKAERPVVKRDEHIGGIENSAETVLKEWEESQHFIGTTPTLVEDLAVLGQLVVGAPGVSDNSGHRYMLNQNGHKSGDFVQQQLLKINKSHLPFIRSLWNCLKADAFSLALKLLYQFPRLSNVDRIELTQGLVDIGVYFGELDKVFAYICEAMLQQVCESISLTSEEEPLSTFHTANLIDPVFNACIARCLGPNRLLGGTLGGWLSATELAAIEDMLSPFIISLAARIQGNMELIRHSRTSGSSASDSSSESEIHNAEYEDWCVEDECLNFVKALSSPNTTLSHLPKFIQFIIISIYRAYDKVLARKNGSTPREDRTRMADLNRIPQDILLRVPAAVACMALLVHIFAKAAVAAGERITNAYLSQAKAADTKQEESESQFNSPVRKSALKNAVDPAQTPSTGKQEKSKPIPKPKLKSALKAQPKTQPVVKKAVTIVEPPEKAESSSPLDTSSSSSSASELVDLKSKESKDRETAEGNKSEQQVFLKDIVVVSRPSDSSSNAGYESPKNVAWLRKLELSPDEVKRSVDSAAHSIARKLFTVGIHAFVECLHHVERSRRRRRIIEDEVALPDLSVRAGRSMATWVLQYIQPAAKAYNEEITVRVKSDEQQSLLLLKRAKEKWMDLALRYAEDDVDFCEVVLTDVERENIRGLATLVEDLKEPLSEDTPLHAVQELSTSAPEVPIEATISGPDMV